MLFAPPVRIYNYAHWQRTRQPQPAIPVGLRPWIVRNGLLPETEMTWGFEGVLDPDVTATNLLPSIDFAHLVELIERTGRRDRLPLLMQMAGASHMAVLRPYDAEVVHDPRRFDEIEPVRVLATNNAGRFYFAERLIGVGTNRDVAARLLGDEPLPLRTAFVATTPFRPAPGRIVGLRQTANTISIDAESGGQAFLTIAVTPHKDWRATIDGTDVPLQRTNVGFQGLVVQKGRHRIELRYRNPIVVFCGVVSAAALLLTAIVASLRSRAPQPPPLH